ncbi:unnamed protein product [Eretmochelys imbricata]
MTKNVHEGANRTEHNLMSMEMFSSESSFDWSGYVEERKTTDVSGLRNHQKNHFITSSQPYDTSFPKTSKVRRHVLGVAGGDGLINLDTMGDEILNMKPHGSLQMLTHWIACDPNGRVLFVNPSLHGILRFFLALPWRLNLTSDFIKLRLYVVTLA